ncbi:DUF1566 domain-containing protein [Leptospira langatensis]|uniref:DUF1566 domain-containing protein n=1 Tax=Leptospira langatensis TaxID=2484983 RepID=A0A5F1ZQR1_9LEPT|nr:DUF1566 domain-containing protein [Leptospira langatensis]TGK02804.1 DUF1566 domain-containing protein [Leptospira langatensis]TGL39991.1 DUF1566 domain-containing protein [Leptospira langatensis]
MIAGIRNGLGDYMRRSILLILCIFALPSIAAPFTDNGDGTVTDSATSLVWQQCSSGLSGSSCSTGTATTYTWQNALSYCNTLSLSSKSWRVPSINELKSIIDRSRVAPSISITFFPEASSSTANWSSTTDINSGSGNAWGVSFADGSVTSSVKSGTLKARCVAGP